MIVEDHENKLKDPRMDPGSFKEVINLNLTKLELVLAYNHG